MWGSSTDKNKNMPTFYHSMSWYIESVCCVPHNSNHFWIWMKLSRQNSPKCGIWQVFMPDLTPSTRNSMKAGDRGVIFLRKTSQNTVNNDVLCLRALKPRRNVIFEPLSFDNMHPRCNIHPLLWHVVQQCFFHIVCFCTCKPHRKRWILSQMSVDTRHLW
jgi:hypothetical protein